MKDISSMELNNKINHKKNKLYYKLNEIQKWI